MVLPVLFTNQPNIEQADTGGEMLTRKKSWLNWLQIGLVVILVLSLTVVNFTPAMASNPESGSTCDTEYVVQWGDTLYLIGLRYGVSWPEIAANNGIGSPYWVYAGQHICISGSGSSGASGSEGVSVVVTGNNIDKSVSIKTSKLPKHEIFDVLIGTCASTGIGGKVVGKIKTDGVAAVFSGKVPIPSSLYGVSCLAVRISSRVTSRTGFDTFTNGSGSGTVTGDLNFTVNSVVRNKTVTITVSHAIKGEKYKVYIGPAGMGASGGTLVDAFVPSSNKTFKITYAIPSKYKGATKLDLRIQGYTISGLVYYTFKNTTH
jgi:LysM repeat protein